MMKCSNSTPDGMEGVVVSRQILVGASALTRRPVLETFAERLQSASAAFHNQQARNGVRTNSVSTPDRKSTRLNSSHVSISYAVFCLKKKKPTSLASM